MKTVAIDSNCYFERLFPVLLFTKAKFLSTQTSSGPLQLESPNLLNSWMEEF